MVTYAYTGKLSDIGLGNLGGWLPEMTVRPKVSAFGPDGLISDVRVPVTLTAGAFSMNLVPSGELTPATGGSPGIDYVIEVGRFELADDLTKIWHGTEAWEFTAVVGGGNIGEMNGGSLLAVWIGPPWPADTPAGLYIDMTPPNAWGVRS
ncbi:MAG: hypothetical protein P0Y60_14420 [Candidatus Microbacterium colombiense]|nr:MAG: hypothetical protein P0Y60_14420 [Microbacterium sp.]